MRRIHRRILFWSLVLIFFIIAPISVFYAIGFRYDFQTGKIVETGGIFIKAKPSSVKVYLNNRLKKETSFLTNSALLDNLLPKIYSVKLEKEGYRFWQKNLKVNNGVVTEAKNIILIPQKLLIKKVIEKDNLWQIKDFLFSSDKQQVVFSTINKNNEITVGIYNINNNLLVLKNLPPKIISVKLKAYSEDNNSVLLLSKELSGYKWYILKKNKTENKTELELIEIFKRAFTPQQYLESAEAQVPQFNPKNSLELLFLDGDNLTIFNYETGIVSKAILINVVAYKIQNDRIYFLRDDGLVYQSNLDGTNETMLTTTPLKFNKTKNKEKIKLIISKKINLAMIDAEGNLYLFDREKNNFFQISKKVINIKFSNDDKKLIYMTESELWIYYLENLSIQPFKNVGQKELIAGNLPKIYDFDWYSDDYHFFYLTGDWIKFSDLDDRDQRIIYDLGKSNGEKLYFNGNDERLYFINNSTLYRLTIE